MYKILKQKIKQFFCTHDYEIPEEYNDIEDRNRKIIELKSGESISFARLHVCQKCKKETIIGSGWYI